MSNYILYLISIIIEICACGAYAKTLFQPRHSKFTRFIFLFALCIVLYITSLFVHGMVNICLLPFYLPYIFCPSIQSHCLFVFSMFSF